jgi:branched-chain amino acid transport system substrate-binding protein
MLPSKIVTTLLAIVLAFPAAQSRAQDVVKVGIVMPMTGSFAAAGRQVLAGISLFMRQNGDSVAGKKIQLIVKDDASIPDLSKRMAQELIITDHVSVMGVGLTPNALAIAPLSREAKIPTVLMISGTSTNPRNHQGAGGECSSAAVLHSPLGDDAGIRWADRG